MATATTLKAQLADNADRTGDAGGTVKYTVPAPGAAFTANALVEAWITVISTSAITAPVSVTGGGMTTWTLVDSIVTTGASPFRKMFLYRALQASPGAAAAIDIVLPSGETWTACIADVVQTAGVDTTGTNGANALGPVTKTASAAAGTTTGDQETYFPNPADGGIYATACGTSGTTATPDTGWTEIADHATTTPVINQSIGWRATNDPLLAIGFANSVNWVFMAHALLAAPSATMSHGPVAAPASPTSVCVKARTHNVAATVKVRYSTDSGLASPTTTAGVLSASGDDYTVTVTITGLTADTPYFYDVLVNDVSQIGSPYATFRTPPTDGTAGTYTFCVLSDQNEVGDDDASAAAVYASIDAETPRFVAQLGDLDHRFGDIGVDAATSIAEIRTMHKQLRSGSTIGNALRASVLKKYLTVHTWDDHDYGANNGDKTFALRAASLQAFKEFWAAAGSGGFAPTGGDGIWQSFIYGNAEFFVLDLRSQADPNDTNLSMLGTAQKAWLKAALLASTKKWKVIFSSRPWNGTCKPADSWGNSPAERAELSDYIVANALTGVAWISGDVHGGGGFDVEMCAGRGMIEASCPHTNGTVGDSGPEGYWSEYWLSGNDHQTGYLSITYTATTFTVAIKDETGATRFSYAWDGLPGPSTTGLSAKVGSFNTGTGSSDVVVTGVGFKPRALILWASGRTGAVDAVGRATAMRAVGLVWNVQRRCAGTVSADAVATSLAQAYHSKAHSFVIPATNGTIDGAFDVASMDSDGFTCEINNPFSVDVRVHYLALGGPDLLYGLVDDFAQITTTGPQTFPPSGTAPLPFSPDLLIFLGGPAAALEANAADSHLCLGAADRDGRQGVFIGASDDGAATSLTRSYCATTACLGRIAAGVGTLADLASFTAMTSNGFTVTWGTNAGNTRRHSFMALKFRGLTMGRVGNFLTRTDTAQFSITPLGFTPKAALFASACKGSGAGLGASDQWSMGAATSPSNRAAHATLDEDNQATAEVVSAAVEHDEVYANIAAGGTIQGLMDVVSMDADGMTLVMDDADPATSLVWYLSMGTVPPFEWCRQQPQRERDVIEIVESGMVR